MKKAYKTIVVSLIKFEKEDVICTSGQADNMLADCFPAIVEEVTL